ncbi:unnamed protein product [Strongylus vulgaris]|uniref:Uncharacterized protein n=1 Tax=Strongylus vulgaris TaxID=40348 RepID=A0A3P7IEM0_STRVU|nr:unnamed protein product [Strongylus vulgaris]
MIYKKWTNAVGLSRNDQVNIINFVYEQKLCFISKYA